MLRSVLRARLFRGLSVPRRMVSSQLKDFYSKQVAPENLRPGGERKIQSPEQFYAEETQRVKNMQSGETFHAPHRNFRQTEEGLFAPVPNEPLFPASRKLIDSYSTVIVGGGTAGVTLAKQLAEAHHAVLVIEPSENHFYQPMWTLVGAGMRSIEESSRPLREVLMERNATPLTTPMNQPHLLQAAVTEFLPQENALLTSDGRKVQYKQLVVATGIDVKIDRVKGLRQALGRAGVCTNYVYPYATRTWDFVKFFPGGNAIFTHPATPVKCGGGPQKIMYAAEDHWRTYVGRDRFRVIFNSGQPKQFHIPQFEKTLKEHCERTDIKDINLGLDLIEVKPEEKKAVFKRVIANGTKQVGDIEEFDYTFLHVTPPQGPHQVVADSDLADAAGWVDVDKLTLQSKKYPNVFGLGDCTNLPTSKTAAAAVAQSVVVFQNLQAYANGQPLPATYDGYTACPFIMGYGKGMLAEFDYTLQSSPSFPFLDPTKETRFAFWMKEQFFPAYYWFGPMRGRYLATTLRKTIRDLYSRFCRTKTA